jgi:hypothetical protein
LPVVERKNSRKLVGSIRIRRLMAYVMKEIGAAGATSRRETPQAAQTT